MKASDPYSAVSPIEDSVIRFVAEFTGANRERLTPPTTLLGDLRIDGADGWELIDSFGKEFDVDVSTFQPDLHFGPEGLSLLAPLAWIWWLVSWPFRPRQTAEVLAGLRPIHISDLVRAAEDHRWPSP